MLDERVAKVPWWYDRAIGSRSITFDDLAADAARARGTAQALSDGVCTLTYGELVERIVSLARGLAALGVRRGERVVVALDPSVDEIVTLLAVSRAAGVFVGAHRHATARQLLHALNDAGASVLVTTADRLDALLELGRLPPLRAVVLPDAAARPGVVGFDDLSRATSGRIPVASEEDLAAIVYTSGSTGAPKGVMLSHRNLRAGAESVAKHLSLDHRDRLLGVVPVGLTTGLNQLSSALFAGASLVVVPADRLAYPREILAALSDYAITGLTAVATFWAILARHAEALAKAPPRALRFIGSAGGPIAPAVLRSLRVALPFVRVHVMYGLSEAGRVTGLAPEDLDRRSASMGKPVPSVDAFPIGEDHRPCPPETVGELVVGGPTVALGYWRHPRATANVFRPNACATHRAPTRLCHTGDLAKIDADGFLYHRSRKDAVLKTMGYRISPTEIEHALYEHEAVRAAAVVGVADELLGAAVHAFVVPASETSVDELRAFCAARLPGYMVPRAIHIVGALPRTGTGKVDYARLREQIPA